MKKRKKKKIIIIDEEIDYKHKKYYLGKYKEHHPLSIYIDNKTKDNYSCSLFENVIKEYKKPDMVG